MCLVELDVLILLFFDTLISDHSEIKLETLTSPAFLRIEMEIRSESFFKLDSLIESSEEFSPLPAHQVLRNVECRNESFEKALQLEIGIHFILVRFLPQLHGLVLISVSEDGVRVLRVTWIPPPELSQKDRPNLSPSLPPICIDVIH
jgi:hypothetical protein